MTSTNIDQKLAAVRSMLTTEHNKSTEAFEQNLPEKALASYKAAASIANSSLKAVVAETVVGATVGALCELGDKAIGNRVSNFKDIYKKVGIAFPTCVSTGILVCDVSPLADDPEYSRALVVGDIVRIELAVHVDGHIARTGTTIVIQEKTEKQAVEESNNSKLKDLLNACNVGTEAVIRTMIPGTSTKHVADIIERSAKAFGVVSIEGSMSSQLLPYQLDDGKTAVANPPVQSYNEIKESTLIAGEVYALDIIYTTGTGKTRPTNKQRTTIFKKVQGAAYPLKMRTAREVYGEIIHSTQNIAFSLRNLSNPKKARLGIVECLSSGLITPFDVVESKPNDLVAHIVCTVIVRDPSEGGPIVLTNNTFGGRNEAIESIKNKAVNPDEEIANLIESVAVENPANKRKAKKNKKTAESKDGK